MGTKNNPKNRGKVKEKKKYNGQEIEPILYYAKIGKLKKKYMAAKICGSNKLVCDPSGDPMAWGDIG